MAKESSRPAGEGQLKRLTEEVPVGVIRTDTTGECVFVNERWTQLAGLSAEDSAGTGWVRALHPEDRERVLSGWQKSAVEGKEFAEEFRLRTPEGRTRVVAARVLPIHDEQGQPSGLVGAITDITERQRTEEALRKLANELRVRVKELNCLFGISYIVEQSGGSLDDILRQAVDLLPASWEHSDVACARIVMNGREFRTQNWQESPWKQEAEIVVYGESAGRIEVSYLEPMPRRDEGPFLEEERRLINAVAERLGRTAERLRTEELLSEREQELRERLTHLTRVSVMGEMASSLAHEINQPLTAVAAYAQAARRLLASGKTDIAEVLDVLERIANEALRAGDIVHRLKELVRKRESRRDTLDVNDLIRDVANLASVDARLHDVRLRLELAESLPPVQVDGIQIQQVLLNMIRNGIDAMEDTEPARREVVVRTEADGSEVQVSVRDNGIGVPDVPEDRLFQPFFTTKKGGMGMGLSISRSIVQAHGGRMWYEPNADGGVTFYFTLPATKRP